MVTSSPGNNVAKYGNNVATIINVNQISMSSGCLLTRTSPVSNTGAVAQPQVVVAPQPQVMAQRAAVNRRLDGIAAKRGGARR